MEKTLNRYAEIAYSQNGEDGVLKEALARLGVQKGFFVEFGAWNGTHLSNTYRLFGEEGWSGLMIEGDRDRFLELQSALPAERIQKLNAFVGIRGPNSLDAILTRQGVHQSFEVLSVDVDSDDYRIWESTKAFSPVIVIIEYNPTIPNAVPYIQPEGAHKGNSARALFDLGVRKGYKCFASTRYNLLFVRQDHFPKLALREPTLDEVRPDTCFVYTLYDGEIVFHGYPVNKRGEVLHPWQALRMPQLPGAAGWTSRETPFFERWRQKYARFRSIGGLRDRARYLLKRLARK